MKQEMKAMAQSISNADLLLDLRKDPEYREAEERLAAKQQLVKDIFVFFTEEQNIQNSALGAESMLKLIFSDCLSEQEIKSIALEIAREMHPILIETSIQVYENIFSEEQLQKIKTFYELFPEFHALSSKASFEINQLSQDKVNAVVAKVLERYKDQIEF